MPTHVTTMSLLQEISLRKINDCISMVEFFVFIFIAICYTVASYLILLRRKQTDGFVIARVLNQHRA